MASYNDLRAKKRQFNHSNVFDHSSILHRNHIRFVNEKNKLNISLNYCFIPVAFWIQSKFVRLANMQIVHANLAT